MSVTATVVIDDARLARMLQGRDGAVGRVMAGFAGTVTQDVRIVARERVNHPTGEYLRGISSHIRPGPMGTMVEVRADAPHSAVLEGGSSPHTIRPARTGGVLRFRVGGRVVFARKVEHPGTRPYHILRDGVRRSGERLGR